MTTYLTRTDLQRAIGNDPKTLIAFEELFAAKDAGVISQTLNAAATAALQDATVLTTSPNDTFTNERVVSQGRGIAFNDTGTQLIIGLAFNFNVLGGGLTVAVNAPTTVSIPFSGTVMIQEHPMLPGLGDFADDVAAAAGGVPVNGLYRTASAVKVRVS